MTPAQAWAKAAGGLDGAYLGEVRPLEDEAAALMGKCTKAQRASLHKLWTLLAVEASERGAIWTNDKGILIPKPKPFRPAEGITEF